MFGKLFGDKNKKSSASVLTVAPECPHAVMVPRWDSVGDMGKTDKATRFMCEACHKEFTPQEAESIRDTLVARLAIPDEAQRASVATTPAADDTAAAKKQYTPPTKS